MATSGEKRWPPVGIFVATSGEKPMAIDTSGSSPHRPRRKRFRFDRPRTSSSSRQRRLRFAAGST